MSGQPLPKPKRAIFPDGGSYIQDIEVKGTNWITAHEGGIIRVWLGIPQGGISNPMRDDLPYYDIDAVGMTRDELDRSIGVAVQMLKVTNNRQARRAN